MAWAGCQRFAPVVQRRLINFSPHTDTRGHVVQNSLVLSADLHAPARARAWAQSRVAAITDHRTDDALLVVSELVTNAVRHAGTDVVLNVVVHPDRIHIEVSDGADDLPIITSGGPDSSRPDGRGLVIVAALAINWGVTRMPDRPGKTVWADIPLPARHR